MATSPTTIPGLLWVASQITQPTKLSETKLCDWYENQHIDEVVSLPGISAAARYERIPLDALAGPAIPAAAAVSATVDGSAGAPAAEDPEWLIKAKWLTLYEMRDVEYRNTREFQGLDGQTTPKGNLQKEIFELAKFETRFGALEQIDEGVGSLGKGPAELLISATLNPGSEQNAEEIDRWYREEHVPLLSRCPGYIRTRRYKYVDTTVLDEFQRKSADPVGPGSWVAIHEFAGPHFPIDDIMKTDETERTKDVLSRILSSEAGFFRLKRVYGEFLLAAAKL